MWILCGGVSYAASFQTSGPGLFPISPDRALPRQRVLAVGFWGCGGSAKVFGPAVEDINRLHPRSSNEPYDGYASFHSVLDQFPEVKREAANPAKMGFLRMTPTLWYGIRSGSLNRLQSDGRGAWSGQFSWFPRQEAKIPAGWKVVSQVRRLVRLSLNYPNPAYYSGGIGVTVREPNGWRLADIGLSSDETYVVDWASAWDSPFSEWYAPKPTVGGSSGTLSMDPIVLAEVYWTKVQSPSARDSRVIERPSGWVVSAGIFKSLS